MSRLADGGYAYYKPYAYLLCAEPKIGKIQSDRVMLSNRKGKAKTLPFTGKRDMIPIKGTMPPGGLTFEQAREQSPDFNKMAQQMENSENPQQLPDESHPIWRKWTRPNEDTLHPTHRVVGKTYYFSQPAFERRTPESSAQAIEFEARAPGPIVEHSSPDRIFSFSDDELSRQKPTRTTGQTKAASPPLQAGMKESLEASPAQSEEPFTPLRSHRQATIESSTSSESMKGAAGNTTALERSPAPSPQAQPRTEESSEGLPAALDTQFTALHNHLARNQDSIEALQNEVEALHGKVESLHREMAGNMEMIARNTDIIKGMLHDFILSLEMKNGSGTTTPIKR